MRPQRPLLGALTLTAIVGLLGGCAYAPPDPYIPAPPMWGPPPSSQVIRVYEEPPLVQPATVFIDVAPPPLLVEVRPVRPSFDAVWIGGYWGWQSRWVWMTGRWAPPPRPGYVWMNPYYENRGGGVVFVSGFWRGPGAVFAPPPPHWRMPPGQPQPPYGGRRDMRGMEWNRRVTSQPVIPVPGPVPVPVPVPAPAPADTRPPNDGRPPGSPPRQWGGPRDMRGHGEHPGRPPRGMAPSPQAQPQMPPPQPSPQQPPRAERADPPRQGPGIRGDGPRRDADADRGDRRSERRQNGWGGRKRDDQP